MRFKKLIAPVLIIGIIVTSLTGCGKKVTAESLITECKTNQKKVKSASEQINMDLSIDLSASGIIIPIKMDSSLSVAHEGKTSAYINGNFDITAFNENQSIPVETYVLKDDKNITTYTYDADSETWSSSISELEDEEISNIQDVFKEYDIYQYFLDNKDNVVLDKETILHNNKDCYVLTTTLNTKDFSEYIINNFTDESIKVLDLSKEEIDKTKENIKNMKEMEFPIKCYIYKDSVLPAYLEFDLTDSLKKYENDINELINNASKSNSVDTLKESEEETKTSISCIFDKFKITISFNNYNETKIEIPSEVKESAVNENIELEF